MVFIILTFLFRLFWWLFIFIRFKQFLKEDFKVFETFFTTAAKQQFFNLNVSTHVCGILHKVTSTRSLIDSVRINSRIDCNFRLVHQVTEVRIICKWTERKTNVYVFVQETAEAWNVTTKCDESSKLSTFSKVLSTFHV